MFSQKLRDFLSLLIVLLLFGCSTSAPSPRPNIVGRWQIVSQTTAGVTSDTPALITIEFFADGTYMLAGLNGDYSFPDSERLKLEYGNGTSSLMYRYSLSDNTLTLDNGSIKTIYRRVDANEATQAPEQIAATLVAIGQATAAAMPRVPDNRVPTLNATQAPPAVLSKIGERIPAGEFALTVKSVERADKSYTNTYQLPNDKTLVAVQIEIETNKWQVFHTVASQNAKLIGKHGTYTLAPFGWKEKSFNKPFDAEGKHDTGWLTFEVNKNDSEFVLIYMSQGSPEINVDLGQ